MAGPAWFNNNRNRAYPFVRETVNRPIDGDATVQNLNNSVIVDAGFRMGPESRFETGEHGVYLLKIRRQSDWFYFDFASTAPSLAGVVLTFSRHVDSEAYLTEFVDSGDEGLSLSSLSSGSIREAPCDEPLWEGFLVTGTLDDLVTLFDGQSIDELLGDSDYGVIEPALIHNLSGSYVTSLNLANDMRTRVEAAEGCDEVVFPYPDRRVRVAARCLLGPVVVLPGYNCAVTQSQRENSITLSAAVGAGAGEPCEPVAAFPGEAPPPGSQLLEGGPTCNEVLRSINGFGGRRFQIIGGRGVTVTPAANEHKITIALDMTGLAICPEGISFVSEDCD